MLIILTVQFLQWRKFASQKLMWSLRNVSNAEMHRNRRIRSLARDKIPPSILFNVRSAWSPIVNWRSFISVFLHQAVVLAWNRMSRRRKVRWNNFKFENLKKKNQKSAVSGKLMIPRSSMGNMLLSWDNVQDASKIRFHCHWRKVCKKKIYFSKRNKL